MSGTKDFRRPFFLYQKGLTNTFFRPQNLDGKTATEEIV